MSKEQLALRPAVLADRGAALPRAQRQPVERRVQLIPRKLKDLYRAPILIDDSPAPTVLEIRAKCRRLKSENKLDLVLIDYLQLIRPGHSTENRVQEISQISRSLKALAKELEVPVIALSQLSRAVEQRTGKDKRPQLSDLRESGALEQDADLVMFVFREEMYNREDPKLKGKAEILIAKQRNGPTGDVPLTFRHEFTQFVPYSPVMEGETAADAPPDDFAPF
jgi:replicative DNA helicase